MVADERKNALAIPQRRAALPRHPTSRLETCTRAAPGQRRVWVLEGRQASARSVKTGASDGQYSELLGGDFKEGDEVLTDVRGGEA